MTTILCSPLLQPVVHRHLIPFNVNYGVFFPGLKSPRFCIQPPIIINGMCCYRKHEYSVQVYKKKVEHFMVYPEYSCAQPFVYMGGCIQHLGLPCGGGKNWNLHWMDSGNRVWEAIFKVEFQAKRQLCLKQLTTPPLLVFVL